MRRPVLHFLARWLPASEGFVYDLVRSVAHPGVVVATRPFENLDRFPFPALHSVAGPAGVPARWRRKLVTARLLALAARHGTGLVHAHHDYDCTAALGLVRRRRLPFVLSLHGDDVTGLVDEVPDFYRAVVPHTTAVVVPSHFLAEHAVRAGFDPSTIRVLPSGVDTAYFAPTPLPDGPPEVLFVGRFVAKKGLDVLAEAWPLVEKQVPGATLRLLGFGPLEHVARSIPGSVEVGLAPTRAAVRDAMRRARVVVSPSRTAPGDAVESLLVVNLEAQASGRPLVTTAHGGIPEHVRAGDTALVVPEADAHALADALVALCTDDALAGRLAAAGPAWAERYDLARTAAAVDRLYDECTGALATVGAS